MGAGGIARRLRARAGGSRRGDGGAATALAGVRPRADGARRLHGAGGPRGGRGGGRRSRLPPPRPDRGPAAGRGRRGRAALLVRPAAGPRRRTGARGPARPGLGGAPGRHLPGAVPRSPPGRGPRSGDLARIRRRARCDPVPRPRSRGGALTTDQNPFAGTLLGEVIAAVRPRDAAAERAARERLDRMTKPPGSLGVLEDVAAQLAGPAGAGACPAPLPVPAVVAVFAGDHGVHAQGVTPWPQEVTAQMVANLATGGAVVNAFAAELGVEVVVVDVGVAAPLAPAEGLLDRRIRPGTADLSEGPAMTIDEARRAVEAGVEVATRLATASPCLITGDMGIANTTASAALICAFTRATPAAATGRGAGVDGPTLARKIGVVARAAARVPTRPTTPAAALAVLAEVGGLEHAALAGFVLGAAAARVPVLLDGVIT